MTGGIVVVLGGTGRNFAAGMSGGVAYVLDEDGQFDRRCNLSMVDLESVADEGTAPGVIERTTEPHYHADMRAHDEPRLRGLIERHLAYTGSAPARRILDDWDRYRGKFVKVMPVDYRRALGEILDETTVDQTRVAEGAD